ncbi:MAG TPA: DUF6801 domain-containing protein [Pseudonocardiaceae bacterium]|jgi:hypothetical protein|nr:DUF6801 domain-containing protein [Pseudonocardiaceae bacterium]
MVAPRSSTTVRRVAVLTAVGAVATVLGSGIASADISVDKTFTWSANWPNIGTVSPISTEVLGSMVSPVPEGTPENSDVTVDIDAPPSVTKALIDAGATTVTGSGDAWITVTDPAGTKANIDVPLSGSPVAVPAAGSDLTAQAAGVAEFPGTFDTGTATAALDAGHVFVTLDPRNAAGTDLGAITVGLSLAPDSQDTTLAQVQVVSGS